MLPNEKDLEVNEDEDKALEEVPISNEKDEPALEAIPLEDTSLEDVNQENDDIALEQVTAIPNSEPVNFVQELDSVDAASLEGIETDADRVNEAIYDYFKKKSISAKEFFTVFLRATDEYPNLSMQDYKNFLETIVSFLPEKDIPQYKALYAKILAARQKRIKEYENRLALENTKQAYNKELNTIKKGIDETLYRSKEIGVLNNAYKTSINQLHKLTVKMDYKARAEAICKEYKDKIRKTKKIKNIKRQKLALIFSSLAAVLILIAFFCIGAIPKVQYKYNDESNTTYAAYGVTGLYLPFHYPMKNVKIDKFHNGKVVTEIAESAFEKTDIESIVLPDSITDISTYAFLDCKNLKNVNTLSEDNIIENYLCVNHIGLYAFSGCEKLESFMLTTDIRSIGAYAFLDCNKDFKIKYLGSSELWSSFSGGSGVPVEFQKFVIRITDTGRTVTVSPGEAFYLGVAPSKAGYDVDGYYHNNTKIATETGASVGVFSYTSDIRVSIKYIPKKYRIHCDVLGTTHLVEYDSTFTLPVPENTEDGAFIGWYAYNSSTNKYSDQITDYAGRSLNKYTYFKDLDVQAQYKKDFQIMVKNEDTSILVQFDSKGGSYVSSQTLSNDNPNLQYFRPTRNGFVFTGWYKDEDCTLRVQSDEKITENTTFYAGWRELPSNPGNSYYIIDPVDYQTESDPLSIYLGGYSSNENPLNAYFIADKSEIIINCRAYYYGYTSYEYALYYRFYNVTKNAELQSYTLLYPNTQYKRITLYADEGDLICISAYGNSSNYSTNFQCYFSDVEEKTYLGKYEVSYPVVYGEDYTLPVLQKEGYDFAGYGYKGPNSTITIMLTNEMGESLEPWGYGYDLEIFAVFTPKEYHITYELNGGELESTNPNTYTIQTDNIVLNHPTKDHYTFAGWFDNAEFSGFPIERINRGTIGDIALYAKYVGNTYYVNMNGLPSTVTVFFNSLGGSSVPSQTLTVESPVLAYPEDPTREGYIFAGWYEDSTCTKKFNFKDSLTADKTLYANWKPCIGTYNQKYCIEPYKYDSYTSSPYSLTSLGTGAGFENCVYFLANQTKTYSIAYRVSVDSGSLTTNQLYVRIYNFTQSRTILDNAYPISATNSYSYQSFSAREGDVIGVSIYKSSTSTSTPSLLMYFENFTRPTSSTRLDLLTENVYSVTYGEAYTLPITEKTGYGFDGYYLDSNYITRITDELGNSLENWSFTENKTLYPKYVEGVYKIFYILNGGTFPLGETIPYSYLDGNSAITLSALTKEGHTFNGWYTNSGFAGSPVLTIPANSTGNKVFYAKFTPQTYRVTLDSIPTAAVVEFNSMGGSEVESQTLSADHPVLDYPTSPTKTGYIFGGWFTDEDCTTEFKFEETIDSSLTLYAKWYTGIPLLNQGPISVNYTTEDRYFAFISPISQIITVYSTGTGDSYGSLYDSTKNTRLTYDDDSGQNTNFRYTYQVEANVLYYIAVRGFSQSGTCSLYVTGSTDVVSTAEFQFSSNLQIITYGSNFQLPILNENGKEFRGWCIDEELTILITDETGRSLVPWTFLEDKRVYASWVE